jgi:hypothetical protein
MSNDYLPRNEQELAAWAEGYKVQINTHAANLGIHNPQVVNVIQAIDTYAADLDTANRLAEQYHAAIAKKEQSKLVMISAVRTQANAIKNSINYNETVGTVLNIIASESGNIDLNTLKPSAKISKSVQGVKISYVKKGMDGVIAYCRRAGEQNFTILDKYTQRHCEDRRANINNAPAELREYYLVFFKKDQPVGQASDIISIMV